jgi:uncharacterized protein (TIGR02466 family)|tara:strand:- start:2280 stop:2894 length:615 start_codon:yes stop_codon:yes gene_type:complete
MKEIQANISGIFPIPIYITNLGRKFTKQEINFFIKTARPNEGNTTSIDSYVLDKKPFSKLKKYILKNLDNYFKKIIDPLENIKPYITQSWINYTKPNQYHHQHRHSNSLVSGVLYLDVDVNYDKIFFVNDTHDSILIQSKNFNVFNSKNWFFPVKTGELILFPSDTKHYVENKKGENTRISLSFNTFVKGKLGKENDLTKLILK